MADKHAALLSWNATLEWLCLPCFAGVSIIAADDPIMRAPP
jgi:hypothetical protein